MCGRYFLDALPETLLEYFSISGTPGMQASYNIAPTQSAGIVANGEGPRWQLARWGLVPFWAKDVKIGNRMINARSETVAEKNSFRAAWKRRRCIVPASGFFEWQRSPSGKQPYAIRPANAPLFAFGGIWERWQQPDGESLQSFCILTTQANEAVAPIHDRMPVILPRDAFGHWLATEEPRQLTDLLAPCPAEWIEAYPVSREVNKPVNNHAGLLERLD